MWNLIVQTSLETLSKSSMCTLIFPQMGSTQRSLNLLGPTVRATRYGELQFQIFCTFQCTWVMCICSTWLGWHCSILKENSTWFHPCRCRCQFNGELALWLTDLMDWMLWWWYLQCLSPTRAMHTCSYRLTGLSRLRSKKLIGPFPKEGCWWITASGFLQEAGRWNKRLAKQRNIS